MNATASSSQARIVAQRRPGREPRRHAARGHAHRHRPARSTKAGARTPATPHAPGDGAPGAAPLNEGRGANPGDTGSSGRSGSPRTSLNEGRGANPGDTGRTELEARLRVGAQRRPGREPRRHLPRPHGLDRRLRRSTKAGARTPATRPGRRSSSPSDCSLNEGRGANPGDTCPAARAVRMFVAAQRRPGREPRRHARGARGRSGPRRALNEGRGANPGDTRTRGDAACIRAALNEGRGANPGDTGRLAGRLPARAARSTKAGARTPATPGLRGTTGSPCCSLNEGRGANPGDTLLTVPYQGRGGTAQRRPGREPRRHPRVREMSPPDRTAQRRPGREPRRHPGDAGRCGGRASPLNEGRGANPGDTCRSASSRPRIASAQRRPGREPRRHPGSMSVRVP